MRYAKLINNYPQYAPNPIRVGEEIVGNPPDAVYEEQGYMPVIETPAPECDAQHYPVAHWTEQDGQIVQSWTVEEIPASDELTPEEALDILLGGAET